MSKSVSMARSAALTRSQCRVSVARNPCVNCFLIPPRRLREINDGSNVRYGGGFSPTSKQGSGKDVTGLPLLRNTKYGDGTPLSIKLMLDPMEMMRHDRSKSA